MYTKQQPLLVNGFPVDFGGVLSFSNGCLSAGASPLAAENPTD